MDAGAEVRGARLSEQGDAEAARALYQQAVASGHADTAPMAAFNFRNLLGRQGDLEAAKEAYRHAVGSGRAYRIRGTAAYSGIGRLAVTP